MHTRVCLYWMWVWVWRSGDNLVELVLSCHLDVCSVDQTQVTRLRQLVTLADEPL